MSVLRALLISTLFAAAFAARVSPSKTILAAEASDTSAHVFGNYVVMNLNSCQPDETYGLDENGKCRLDINNNGALDRFAPDECCLDCHPGATYGRDESGRCRTDVNHNGILDRFANGECCECDAKATFGRDSDGRCRTDVNNNGLLDRFAKDVCCGEKLTAVSQEQSVGTYHHPTYGEVTTKEQCESKHDKMSTRNTRDCIACVTEGSKDIEHPERCVAADSNLVPFPSRPGGDMMTFPAGCPARRSNGGNPATWVAFAKKCVNSNMGSITVHGSSTTGSMSPMPSAIPTKCCKTASKCAAASVRVPDNVPETYTAHNLRASGECAATDGDGNPAETVENVCCESD